MLLNIGSIVFDGKKNKYILKDIIGQGGFGFVFKAVREYDGKFFAIKTTLPAFYDKSSEDASKNEMRVASMINGDNIIHYEFVHGGEQYPELPPYIIMEYANGGTLRELINQRKKDKLFFREEELIELFRQLATGMRIINDSLVHRDIKPENILICDSRLKISDFGLSKVAIEKTRIMSFKSSEIPLYMSPEAWDYSKNTIQMDIYSMGIIFCELAALEYPYKPMPRSQEEARNLHLYFPIQNIKNVHLGLTPRLVSIFNRMLEKSPRRRFENWNEIIQALDQLADSELRSDNIVAMAVNEKNNLSLERQKQASEQKRKAKEREDSYKIVHSQFNNAMKAVLKEYYGIEKG